MRHGRQQNRTGLPGRLSGSLLAAGLLLLCFASPAAAHPHVWIYANVDLRGAAGVIEALDVDTIYQVPLEFRRQRLDDFVLSRFGIRAPAPDLTAWRRIVDRIKSPTGSKVRIAVVGKYTELVDAYKTVEQALIHGGIANDVEVKTRPIANY